MFITNILSSQDTNVNQIFIDTSLSVSKDSFMTRIMIAFSRFLNSLFGGGTDSYNKAKVAEALAKQIEGDAKTLDDEQKDILAKNLQTLMHRLTKNSDQVSQKFIQQALNSAIISLYPTQVTPQLFSSPKSTSRGLDKESEFIFDRQANFQQVIRKSLQKEIKNCLDCRPALEMLLLDQKLTKYDHLEDLQTMEQNHLKEGHT